MSEQLKKKVLIWKEGNFLSITFMIFCLLIIYHSIILGKLWLTWDMYLAAFPLSVEVSAAIKNGAFPLWEPFIARGVPLANLLGYPIWSPLTLIFAAIGYTQYLLQLQYIVIVVASSIFTYMALRNFVNNPWYCALGGLAYATSGLFIGNAEHITFITAAALFPLLHFAVWRWLKHQNNQWTILIGVVLGLLILNNYPPFVIMSSIFILIEIIFNAKSIFAQKSPIIFFKSFAMVVIISVLVGFVGIYTNLQVIHYITRSVVPWEEATMASLNLWNWTGVISPVFVQIAQKFNIQNDISMANTYLSLPVLIFALIKAPKKKIEIEFFILAAIGFLISMGKYGLLYKIIYLLPGMDSFRFPSGLRYFFFYYIILLGVMNLSYIFNEGFSRLSRIFILISYFFGLTAWLLVLLVATNLNVMLPAYTISELLSSALLFWVFSRLILGFNEKKFSIFIFLFVAIFAFIGVFRNGAFTLGQKERPESFQVAISSLYSEDNKSIANIFVKPTDNYTIPSSLFNRQFQTGGYLGSFCLKDYNDAKKEQQLPKEGDPVFWTINQENVDNNNKQLYIKEQSREITFNKPEFINVKPNEIGAIVDMEREGYGILEQTYFPGWQAFVNGKPTEILHFKGGVMAIRLGPGKNVVLFQFKPKVTIISAYISIVSWVALLTYSIFLIFKKINLRIPKVGKYN